MYWPNQTPAARNTALMMVMGSRFFFATGWRRPPFGKSFRSDFLGSSGVGMSLPFLPGRTNGRFAAVTRQGPRWPCDPLLQE